MSAQMHPEKRFLCHSVPDADGRNLEFETLLNYLNHNYGCDLTSYKRSSLMRRFQHRMGTLQIDTYQSYLKYLQDHSHEYMALLDDVLINFTGFFRDHDTWNYIATDVIPAIIASKRSDEPIRVWSAGCATGQEVYSVLILLAEALGIDVCLQRVQCFATDVDEKALLQARQATYSDREVMGIAPHWLEKYFKQTEKGHVFHPHLSRTVALSRHDLTQNAPIPKIDLLLCRNVLMYFNPNAQAAILSRLHLALADRGFLCVGQAEILIYYRQTFIPANPQQRIYTKGLELDLDDYRAVPNSSSQQQPSVSPNQNHFWKVAFEASSLPYLAVDLNGYLFDANEQARTLFGLTANDWKRPFQELELSQLISSSTIMHVLQAQQKLTVAKNFVWTTPADTRYFNVHISRVLTPQKHVLGVTLTFIETTYHQQRIEELEFTCLELASAAQVLEEKNSELNRVYHELAIIQRELQLLQPEVPSMEQDR